MDDSDTKANYPLLKQLVSSKDIVYYAMDGRNPSISYDKLFSEYIERKIAGFISNLEINASTIDWICKYSKIKAGAFNGKSQQFDYFVRRTNEKGEVFLLGMRRSVDNSDLIYPVSNRYYPSENDPEYKEFETEILSGQMVSYPVYSSENFGGLCGKKIIVTPEEKIKKRDVCDATTERVRTVLESHGMSKEELAIDKDGILPRVDEFEDHGWSLDKFMQAVKTGVVPKRFAYPISLCMSQHRKVNPKDLNVGSFTEIDSSLFEIIKSYNNFANSVGMIGEQNESYFRMVEESDSQRGIIEELERRNSELEAEVAALAKKNSELIESDHAKTKALGTIYDAVIASGIKK